MMRLSDGAAVALDRSVYLAGLGFAPASIWQICDRPAPDPVANKTKRRKTDRGCHPANLSVSAFSNVDFQPLVGNCFTESDRRCPRPQGLRRIDSSHFGPLGRAVAELNAFA